MVRNSEDSSFVSLAQILHPEDAHRQYSNHPSPWATVYYETVSGPVDYENLPMAVDVVALHDEHDEEVHANPQQPQEINSAPPLQSSAGNNATNEVSHLSRSKPWQHSNLLDLILGFTLTIAAFISTLKIELTAILIYTLAAAFHYLAEEVFTAGPFLLAKAICLMICSALMIVDPILLTVSVLVSELLGFVALILCSLFGGRKSGPAWHQFIRKTCHLSRWGFRSCHQGWKPERIFPISMEHERLHTLDATEQEDLEIGLECITSNTTPAYRDAVSSDIATTVATNVVDGESTIVSALTTPAEIEYPPPIDIAPDHVSIIEEERTTARQNATSAESTTIHDEPLLKNIQEVVMT